MKNLSQKQGLLLAFLFGLVWLIGFYGNIIFDPNNHLFSVDGDGIKNYFTYAYQIKHNHSFINFEGMNYPYGEHFLYTDCHPILVFILQSLSVYFPDVANYSVGILNVFMLMSIALCFPVNYLLLKKLGLKTWSSLIFGIGMSLLAPQLFRLSGHLALSYSIAIPLSWLLLLNYWQKPQLHRAIWLGLNGLFWLFIHAYLGMIVLSFLISLIGFSFLIKNKHLPKNHLLVSLCSVIIPLIIFYAFVQFSDTHVERTENPSGFLNYNAEIDNILIPPTKPFRPFFDWLTNRIIHLEWEGIAYVGIFNATLLVGLILLGLVSIRHRKSRGLLLQLFSNRKLNVAMLAALLVLLFAFGVPFKQFPFLLEAFPVFKQFRATGRFTWPFYFAFTAFSAYAFQKGIMYLYRYKNIGIAGIIVLLLFTTSLTEAYYYHYPTSKKIGKHTNVFQINQLKAAEKMTIEQVNPDDYQGIICLPFYYQGSEVFARPRQNEAVRNSIILAYHTGLPLVNANLTRTGITESKRIVQLISPNYYPKPIQDDFPNKKPFLVIHTENKMSKYDKLLLAKTQKLPLENMNFNLRVLPFDALFKDERQKVVNQYRQVKNTLYAKQGFEVNQPKGFIYYNGFENQLSDTTHRGVGSYIGIKKGHNTLAQFPANTFEPNTEYAFSIWMFNNEPDALNLWFRLIVEEYDPVEDTWHNTTFFPDLAETVTEEWSLVEGTFKVKNPANTIAIVTKGKKNAKARLHADDLLIVKKDTEVYRMDSINGTLFYNNHYIKLP